MTMEAAKARERVRDEVARLASELAQARAERDWLAERLEELRPFDCPASVGHLECATVTASGDVIRHCTVSSVSEKQISDCWQRAARDAVTGGEADADHQS